MRQVTIFDTTLRDGEQSPGASLSGNAKFLVAKALADLGVDVIEAGFPAASPGEAEAVGRIARDVRGPTMAALAPASAADVEAAAKALSGALRSRIHVFIATSDRHLERKLRISRYECLARITAAVARATELADEVEFSAEDATRSDVDFLNAAYQAAAGAGARTMNIPDTVGYSQPQEFAALVLAVRAALSGFQVQPNKAVVGANAFAHASGIHQDGVLKDPGTYEIMTPQSVGWEARRIVVSKLSGRRGLQARLAELGLPLDGEALDRAYILAMKRGDEVHELDERDLISIAAEARRSPQEPAFTFIPASTPAD